MHMHIKHVHVHVHAQCACRARKCQRGSGREVWARGSGREVWARGSGREVWARGSGRGVWARGLGAGFGRGVRGAGSEHLQHSAAAVDSDLVVDRRVEKPHSRARQRRCEERIARAGDRDGGGEGVRAAAQQVERSVGTHAWLG